MPKNDTGEEQRSKTMIPPNLKPYFLAVGFVLTFLGGGASSSAVLGPSTAMLSLEQRISDNAKHITELTGKLEQAIKALERQADASSSLTCYLRGGRFLGGECLGGSSDLPSPRPVPPIPH